MPTLDSATVKRLKTLAPHRSAELERLVELTQAPRPAVAVLGQYNHGKSSLLNALIGKDCFSVSDHRETLQTSVQVHQGIEWIDTPGLNADVEGRDDRCAMQAACSQSDVRLFVHALDVGELDASELALLRELLDEQSATGRPTLLVVTRITNRSATQRERMLKVIARQVPDARLIAVSVSSHRRGLAEDRPGFVQLGNLAALQQAIEGAVLEANQVRQHESALIVSTLAHEVKHRLKQAYAQHQHAQDQRQAAYRALAQQCAHLQQRIATEIRG